jgi:hypothetical protein
MTVPGDMHGIADIVCHIADGICRTCRQLQALSPKEAVTVGLMVITAAADVPARLALVHYLIRRAADIPDTARPDAAPQQPAEAASRQTPPQEAAEKLPGVPSSSPPQRPAGEASLQLSPTENTPKLETTASGRSEIEPATSRSGPAGGLSRGSAPGAGQEISSAAESVGVCREAFLEKLRDAKRGLEALALVPRHWAVRLAHLAAFPAHLAESLIMAQQFNSLSKIRDVAPGLAPDHVLLTYAR